MGFSLKCMGFCLRYRIKHIFSENSTQGLKEKYNVTWDLSDSFLFLKVKNFSTNSMQILYKWKLCELKLHSTKKLEKFWHFRVSFIWDDHSIWNDPIIVISWFCSLGFRVLKDYFIYNICHLPFWHRVD